MRHIPPIATFDRLRQASGLSLVVRVILYLIIALGIAIIFSALLT